MKSFQQTQKEFVAHIRDPKVISLPHDIEDRRMNIYRDLLFNNVENFVSTAFPVLMSLYSDQQWQQLIRQFFKQYHCHSPYFVQISEHFLEFLAEEYQPQENDPDFMLELAHYEWVELHLSVKKEQHYYPKLSNQHFENQPLIISELAWPLAYQYPVHKISVCNQPQQPDPNGCHLVVYRDVDHKVYFLAVNAMTALLLQVLHQNPSITFSELINQVQQQVPQYSQEILIQGGQQVLPNLIDKGIIRTLDQLHQKK